MSETKPKVSGSDQPIGREELAADIRKLGIERGDLLHVKASIRSLGPIEGGAGALLAALLDTIGPEGTLVSDAFVKAYPLPLPSGAEAVVSDDHTPTYAGALCQAMIDHPDMRRSRHPIQKGVAIGHLAESLMWNHTAASPAYAPLHEMAKLGAKHLTIGRRVVGVGTTHVAQNLLNLRQANPPLGIRYRTLDGGTALFERNWVGNCGRGFPRFMQLYEAGGAIIAEGMIAAAHAFVSDMGKTLAIELEKLRDDPSFFLCDDPACTSCRLSWEFSDGSRPIVYLRRAIAKVRQTMRSRRRKTSGRGGRSRSGAAG